MNDELEAIAITNESRNDGSGVTTTARMSATAYQKIYSASGQGFGAKGCVVVQNYTFSIKGVVMAVALKLSDELVEDAKPHAAAEHRSVPKQIEYWARIGKAVLENPEMPLRLIQDTILSREEVKAGLATPYQFG